MAFLEIEKDCRENFRVRHLVCGEFSDGCFNGKEVRVSVAESGLLMREEGKVIYCLKESAGSFIYDSNDNVQHGTLFLHDHETIRFIFMEGRLNPSPEKLQQVYKSLWRRLQIDTGNKEAGKWNLERVGDWIKSAGRTETFSDI